MRVLFSQWASGTHYFPMVPLAWALRNAGHEVRVASSPRLIEAITDSGLPAVSVGADVDYPQTVRRHMGVDRDAAMTPAEWQALRTPRGPAALGQFVEVAEAMVDDLLDFARAWEPDLVVHTPTGFAAPVVATALGVPNVRLLYGPDFTTAIAGPQRRLCTALCARLGIDPADLDPLGALTLDPWPGAGAVDHPHQSMRYIPYNGPGIVPDWLLDDAPANRVCVTWGTALAELNPNLMLAGQIVGALVDLDVELVAAIPAGADELLGPVPDGVRVVADLPLHLLLPSCAAIVHQGGAGATMTSAVAGVPQLVVPAFPEQSFNAGKIAETGGAIALMPEDAGVDAIRAAVQELLEQPAVAKAAGDFRDRANALPAPTDVVEVLEELAKVRTA
jgi:UDP:flavonoid glycosyltransferase YjiC (YdhE family)